MWILTRSDTNQTVQPLEMVEGLKFCMKEEEVLYYLSSENKFADQLRGADLHLGFSHMQNVGFLTTQLKLEKHYISHITRKHVFRDADQTPRL